MGFQVMMWICPFVSPDCDVYRELRQEGMLLKNTEGRPALVRWWNGASGLLDLSKENANRWFKDQLVSPGTLHVLCPDWSGLSAE